VTIKTILFEGHVTGHIASFDQSGKREITYWIGKEYWGKGIATKALSEFLDHERARPLYARAAKDNVASLRVLEKCDFTICGHDKGFAYGRGEEIEEYILKLRADAREEAQ
jgi:RimJ/RimL family protein N-acetyltransferase